MELFYSVQGRPRNGNCCAIWKRDRERVVENRANPSHAAIPFFKVGRTLTPRRKDAKEKYNDKKTEK